MIWDGHTLPRCGSRHRERRLYTGRLFKAQRVGRSLAGQPNPGPIRDTMHSKGSTKYRFADHQRPLTGGDWANGRTVARRRAGRKIRFRGELKQKKHRARAGRHGFRRPHAKPSISVAAGHPSSRRPGVFFLCRRNSGFSGDLSAEDRGRGLDGTPRTGLPRFDSARSIPKAISHPDRLLLVGLSGA